MFWLLAAVTTLLVLTFVSYWQASSRAHKLYAELMDARAENTALWVRVTGLLDEVQAAGGEKGSKCPVCMRKVFGEQELRS